MKKYIGFMVMMGLVFSFAGAPVVRAEEGRDDGIRDQRQEDRGNRQEDRGQRQEDRQAFREKMQTERKAFMDDLKTKRAAFIAELKARKDEWGTANTDKKGRFCEAASNMMTVKFRTAFSQLEMFQTRVGEIITKLKADGKDTALAQESLDLSKQKLAAAKTKLAKVKALIPADGCKDMTPEIFEKIKLGAREAKDLLKESREALHQSIKEIKNLKGDKKDDDNDSIDDAQQ